MEVNFPFPFFRSYFVVERRKRGSWWLCNRFRSRSPFLYFGKLQNFYCASYFPLSIFGKQASRCLLFFFDYLNLVSYLGSDEEEKKEDILNSFPSIFFPICFFYVFCLRALWEIHVRSRCVCQEGKEKNCHHATGNWEMQYCAQPTVVRSFFFLPRFPKDCRAFVTKRMHRSLAPAKSVHRNSRKFTCFFSPDKKWFGKMQSTFFFSNCLEFFAWCQNFVAGLTPPPAGVI